MGPGVEVLARIDQGIVAIGQGPHMALSFHPDLGGDLRLHEMYLVYAVNREKMNETGYEQ